MVAKFYMEVQQDQIMLILNMMEVIVFQKLICHIK